MAKVQTNNPTTMGVPRWAGDFMGRNTLIPGGARLVASAFPEVNGVRHVPSGTPIGRTIAERDAGTGFGPVAVTEGEVTDAEIFLVAFDVTDANNNPDVELYRPGAVVKENFLPGYDDMDDAVLAALRQRYICTLGAE